MIWWFSFYSLLHFAERLNKWVNWPTSDIRWHFLPVNADFRETAAVVRAPRLDLQSENNPTDPFGFEQGNINCLRTKRMSITWNAMWLNFLNSKLIKAMLTAGGGVNKHRVSLYKPYWLKSSSCSSFIRWLISKFHWQWNNVVLWCGD